MYNWRDFKFTIGQKTQQNKQTTTKKTQTNVETSRSYSSWRDTVCDNRCMTATRLMFSLAFIHYITYIVSVPGSISYNITIFWHYPLSGLHIMRDSANQEYGVHETAFLHSRADKGHCQFLQQYWILGRKSWLTPTTPAIHTLSNPLPS